MTNIFSFDRAWNRPYNSFKVFIEPYCLVRAAWHLEKFLGPNLH